MATITNVQEVFQMKHSAPSTSGASCQTSLSVKRQAWMSVWRESNLFYSAIDERREGYH